MDAPDESVSLPASAGFDLASDTVLSVLSESPTKRIAMDATSTSELFSVSSVVAAMAEKSISSPPRSIAVEISEPSSLSVIRPTASPVPVAEKFTVVPLTEAPFVLKVNVLSVTFSLLYPRNAKALAACATVGNAMV